MKKRKTLKTRSAVVRDLRTPKYRIRVVADKKRKAKSRWNKRLSDD